MAIEAVMQKDTKINDSSRLNYMLYGLLALMWSGSFINIKVVVEVMPPIFCAMLRVLVSIIGLAVVFTVTRKPFLGRSPGMWRVWVAGLASQAIPFGLLFYGERFVAPALAGIINSTVSLWALLIGTIIFRDFSQWTPIKLGGLILGFIGIVIIFYPSIHNGESDLVGVSAIMLMAVFYAIGGLLNQYVIFPKMKVSFEANLFHQHIASIVMLTVVSLMLETWPPVSSVLDSKVIFSFLYLGLVATTCAWIIFFYLIREWGAVRTSSVMYIVPLLAIVWDLLFLHIMPSSSELVGAAAILVGVVLIQWTRKLAVKTVE